MLDYLYLFVFIFLGGSLSLISTDKARTRAFLVYCIVALPALCLFAGMRGPTVDNDYQNYVQWFDEMKSEGLSVSLFARDLGFSFLAILLNALGLGLATLMTIYAALCLNGQALFAKWLFPSRWGPLGLYLILCRFFIPHEMTQIRAGVAIPLASLAILLFFRRKFWQGSAVLLLASVFHASVLLVLPVIVMILFRAKFRSRLWIGIMVPIAFIGSMVFSNLFSLFSAWGRLAVYVSGAYETQGIRLLSVYVLFRALPLTFLCLRSWDRLTVEERLICFCSSLGLCLQIMFSANDAIALRSAEVFGLFDIAVAILVFRFLRPRATLAYLLCLVAVGGLFFRSGTTLLQPYKTVLSSER